jgi:PilZ domain
MPIRMCEGSGVLTREIDVRVVNISASGCLIETPRRMVVGAVGNLRLEFGGDEYDDDFQVVRCQPIAGAGSIYHVGMKFLWTSPRHQRSIRHAVSHRVGGISRLWLHQSDAAGAR